MRKVLTLLFLATIGVCLPCSAALAQQGIRWQATLDIAKRTAAQSNRLVLVYFWAESCKWCRLMEHEVLSQPSVAAAVQTNYVAVKINTSHFPSIARQYGVTALPAMVVVTPQGQLLDKAVGRMDSATYLARLNRVAAAFRQPAAAPVAQMPGRSPSDMASGAQPPNHYQLPAQSQRPVPFQPPTPQPVLPPAGGGPAGNASAEEYAHAMPPNPPYRNDPFGDRRTPGRETAPAAPPRPQVYRPPTPGPSLSAASPSPPQPRSVLQPPGGEEDTAGSRAGNPLLALDGYCSVQLLDDKMNNIKRWTLGDRRWGVIHRGRTYLFCGPEQARRFFADPDRYAPVHSGNDVVAAAETGQMVSGCREHGVFCKDRIYLFASEANLEKFCRAPDRYVDRAREALPAGPNQHSAAGPNPPRR